MRAILLATVFAFLTPIATNAIAADKTDKAAKADKKEVTLSGEMVCAKCALKEADKCQNVLKVGEGAKETKYYLVQNDVAKKNHKPACSGSAKATVTGTVAEDAGKKTLTASTIKYE
jgi:Family of unknown function (DUF6370)